MTRSQADIADSEQTLEAKNALSTSMDQVISDTPKRKSTRSTKNAKSVNPIDKETGTLTTTGKPRKRASKKATTEAEAEITEVQVDAGSTKTRRKSTKKQTPTEPVIEEEIDSTVAKSTRKKPTKKATTESVEAVSKRTPKKSTKKSVSDQPLESTQCEPTETVVEVEAAALHKQKRKKSTRKPVAEAVDKDPQQVTTDAEAVDVDRTATINKTRKKAVKKAVAEAVDEGAQQETTNAEAADVDRVAPIKKTRKKAVKKAVAEAVDEGAQQEKLDSEATVTVGKRTRKKSTKKTVAEAVNEDAQQEATNTEAVEPKATRKKADTDVAGSHPSEDPRSAATSTETTKESVPAPARRKSAKMVTMEATDPPKRKRTCNRKAKTDESTENMKTLNAYFSVQPKKAAASKSEKSATEERELQSELHLPVHTSQILSPAEPEDTHTTDQQNTATEPQQTLDDQASSKSSEDEVDDIHASNSTNMSPTAEPPLQQAAPNLNESAPSDSLEKSGEPHVISIRSNVVAPPPQRPPIPRVFSSPPTWVTKHSPSDISMVAGNRGVIDQLDSWLKNWQKNVSQSGNGSVKKRGRATGDYRAALLSGPPGVGKTTTAHLVAKRNGYRVIEHNASDVRSRKLIQDKISHMVDNRSMTEFYQSYASQDLGKSKVLLIMDEVDGMSTGDYGGTQELITLIRVTKVPIICICNDIQSRKVQSLKNVCMSARFVNKYTLKEAQSVEQRVKDIAKQENLNLDDTELKRMMKSSHYDIRNTINTLQVHKLLREELEHKEAQSIIDNRQKDREMNIFEIVNVLFSDNTWESKTLEQVADSCYQEQYLTPEMIFENYLKFKPSKAANVQSAEPNGKPVDMGLKLAAEAAESIADGDLMETMMHSNHRHMNDPLLPAVRYMAGTVLPAALLHGKSPGYRLGFPASLGKSSTAIKCTRQVIELRDSMRLRTYASRHEIRREYIPTFNDRISTSLAKEQLDDVTDLLDAYYLNRKSIDILNDFDLSLEPEGKPMSKVPPTAKAKLTRWYKKVQHPVSIAPKDGSDIIKKKAALFTTNDSDEEPILDDLPEEDDVYHQVAI